MASRILLLFFWFQFFSGLSLFAQDSLKVPVPDTATLNPVMVNTQPFSEIDIPVRMDLHSIYQWANAFVDTLYTSPDYPAGWEMEGCDIRYQYRFVRGPFQFKAHNNVLYINFSGYYGVRGATRICSSIGNSPWTPSCSCGFGTEKPRRIDAGFTVQFNLRPNYGLGIIINRTNPVPVDKCEICFFGKDITKIVAAQLKAELDSSVNAMKQQMEKFSLRSYLQTIWDTLQTPYAMPGFGYLGIQPTALRISQVQLYRDSLTLSIGISARPELVQKTGWAKSPLPALSDFRQRSGFRIFIAQKLPYDSLQTLVNAQVAGKQFQAGKGVIKKTIRIDSVRMVGGDNRLFLQVYVSKSAKGIFYLEGVPKWDAARQELWIDSLDFHVASRQFLVRSASWLLDGVITEKLRQLSRFDLSEKTEQLSLMMTRQLNRQVYSGIESKGYLQRFSIEKLSCGKDGLFVEGAVEGKLWLEVDGGRLLSSFFQ